MASGSVDVEAGGVGYVVKLVPPLKLDAKGSWSAAIQRLGERSGLQHHFIVQNLCHDLRFSSGYWKKELQCMGNTAKDTLRLYVCVRKDDNEA